MRTRDPEGKREALLDAGLALAGELGLGRVSVDKVVSAAGGAKGSFFHHFGCRADFLVELHRRFHDRIAAAVDRAVAGHSPGRARLLAGTSAYLDGCRASRAIRAILVEARAEPAVHAPRPRRHEQFSAPAEPDLPAIGRSSPASAAR